MNMMSLTAASFLYHIVGFCMVALCVSWFYWQRSWLRVLSGGLILLASSLILAILMSVPGFNPLRASRFLCFGWFIHVPMFLIGISVAPRVRGVRLFTALLVLSILVVTYYSFLVEPYRLEVTRYRVPSSKVTSPFTVAVLADFQTDHFGDYERESLRKLMQEKPDMIVVPGDILQADSRDQWESLRDRMNAFLREIEFTAPLGVFAVGGNTDFQNRWPEIFQGLDVNTMIATTSNEMSSCSLTGLSVEDSFDPSLQVASQDGFHIALGHAPDFSLSPDVQADLLVAGHTHGGQVCLPFLGPIITFSRVPRSWASGMTRIDERRTLIVSRGVGMERRDAPRLRFLCRPQLVFVDVVPAAPAIVSGE